MPTRLLPTSHKSTSAYPHPKVKQNNHNKTDANNSRTPFLIVHALDIAAFANLVHSPDVEQQAVDKSDGGEDGECPR